MVRKMGNSGRLHYTPDMEKLPPDATMPSPGSLRTEYPVDLPSQVDDPLRGIADNTTTFSDDCRLPQLFDAMALPPAAAAIISGKRIWTYRQIAERVDSLTAYLCGLGVVPGMIVAVAADRSPELVVALLAVLKTGGAYLPLDPMYPALRLAFMLEDCQVRILIAQQALKGRFPAHQYPIVWLTPECETDECQIMATIEAGTVTCCTTIRRT